MAAVQAMGGAIEAVAARRPIDDGAAAVSRGIGALALAITVGTARAVARGVGGFFGLFGAAFEAECAVRQRGVRDGDSSALTPWSRPGF